MTTPPDMLQRLRRTVLTHAIDGLPDLAAMAADLGAWVAGSRGREDRGLSSLLSRSHGHEQWLLGEHRQPRVSMMLTTWPAHYSGQVQEEGRFWSVELVLQGALRIDHGSGPEDGDATSCEWLGAGDVRIIRPDRDGLRYARTRNLSKSDTAVSLHVFGSSPAGYLSSVLEEASPGAAQTSAPMPAGPTPAVRPRHPLQID